MTFWASVKCSRRSRLEERGKADGPTCPESAVDPALTHTHDFCARRYNFFKGCPKAKTCTIILRGGAEQFTEETERSLHDAIMIVRRAIKVRGLGVRNGQILSTPSTRFQPYAVYNRRTTLLWRGEEP